MKRIHFDSKGPVPWHYFFWQPWGCLGCLWRTVVFVLLLALFLFLLSQFRSCRDTAGTAGDPYFDPTAPVSVVVPPIDDDDIIDDDNRRIVANRLNILFDTECGRDEINQWRSEFHNLYPDTVNRVLFLDYNTKLMSIQVDAEKREFMLENLNSQIPDIPFLVFLEDVLTPSATPNDPVFNNPQHAYSYSVIKAEDAWGFTQGSGDVIVAVVDDFMDLNHPDLADKEIVSPYSVARGDDNVGTPPDYNPEDPYDTRSHGTHTSSLAVGLTNNGRGIAGIASGARLMPISIGDPFGSLAMVQGVLYAINHGATVINASMGSYFPDVILQLPPEAQVELSRTMALDVQRVWDYIFEMCQRNYITMVWSAGNQNVFTAMDSSKRNPNTIRVSAIDRNMRKADFSNFGNFPGDSIYESTLSAPGVEVAAAKAGTQGYELVPGTSFSSPIVAGCVALVKSVDATLTTREIIDLLQSTGVPARGPGADSIGPIVQIGPALTKLCRTLPTNREFQDAINRGTGEYHLGRLFYANIDDEDALPPIFIVQIKPTGERTGKVIYSDNRTPQTVYTADYTARMDGDQTVLDVRAATRTEGESVVAPPTESVFTFSKADNGNPYMSEIRADWFVGPFYVAVVNKNERDI